MIIQQETRKSVTTAPIITAQYHITQDAAFHIAGLLREMYKDPVKAVIKEYASNAYDAHVLAGKTAVPIEIGLPTTTTPTYTVRDYGPGLCPDDVAKLLCGYGSSGAEKRASNDFIGAYGIGCKSAFAICTQFTYTVWHGGKKYVWVCLLDDHDMGSAKLLSETVSKDPTGIQVDIPIKRENVSEFASRAVELFTFWDVRPTIIRGTLDYSAVDQHVYAAVDMDVDGKTVRAYLAKASSYARQLYRRGGGYGDNGTVIVMGQFAYQLDLSQIPGHTDKYPPMRIHVPNGSIPLTPSRENIKYTNDTKRKLAALLDVSFNALMDAFARQVRVFHKKSVLLSSAYYSNVVSELTLEYYSAAKSYLSKLTSGEFKDLKTHAVFKLKADDYVDSAGRVYNVERGGSCTAVEKFGTAVYGDLEKHGTIELPLLATVLFKTKQPKSIQRKLKRLVDYARHMMHEKNADIIRPALPADCYTLLMRGSNKHTSVLSDLRYIRVFGPDANIAAAHPEIASFGIVDFDALWETHEAEIDKKFPPTVAQGGIGSGTNNSLSVGKYMVLRDRDDIKKREVNSHYWRSCKYAERNDPGRKVYVVLEKLEPMRRHNMTLDILLNVRDVLGCPVYGIRIGDKSAVVTNSSWVDVNEALYQKLHEKAAALSLTDNQYIFGPSYIYADNGIHAEDNAKCTKANYRRRTGRHLFSIPYCRRYVLHLRELKSKLPEKHPLVLWFDEFNKYLPLFTHDLAVLEDQYVLHAATHFNATEGNNKRSTEAGTEKALETLAKQWFSVISAYRLLDAPMVADNDLLSSDGSTVDLFDAKDSVDDVVAYIKATDERKGRQYA